MYLALYRKYRPRTFDDVISQEHITTTLKNQITTGTAAHAYLFTGSRGTGKTTCAKILAMAVNCLHPVNGNPCLECAACREIADGSAVDIVEMDAASNNGVDDVRALRDEMSYTPVSCKYRVYIIDEVHMLSANAFNALLKTLEEPPEHVKFILATTELHKVLPTIISRCQRFDFRRINPADSVKRLLYVAGQEGFTLDEDAAELIAALSDGGMRDALSLLDRCMNTDGGRVSAQAVRDCAGVADSRYLYSFSQMIAAGDAPGCLKLLNTLYADSKDIARIIDELSTHYRDLMLRKAAPADRALLSVISAEYPQLDAAAELYTLDDILRCLTLLQQCADSIGKSRQRKTLAEMCLVRMCLKLSAQTEGAPKPPPMNVVRPAPSANLPAGTAVQIFDIEQPAERFEPTPAEKLSPQNAAALNKLRALKHDEPARSAPVAPAQPAFAQEEAKPSVDSGEPLPQGAAISQSEKHPQEAEPAKSAPVAPAQPAFAQEEAKPSADSGEPLPQGAAISQSEKHPQEAEPAVNDMKPSAAESAQPEHEAQNVQGAQNVQNAPSAPFDEAPPLEEAPPEDEPPVTQEKAVLAESATPAEHAAPAEHAVPAEHAAPAEHATPAEEKAAEQKPAPREITQAEWDEAVERLYPMTRAMFSGTRVQTKDGVLEIHTANKLLIQGGSDGSLQSYEREISEALGADIRIRIVPEEEKTAAEEISAVEKLLDKAKGLDIEVIYK